MLKKIAGAAVLAALMIPTAAHADTTLTVAGSSALLPLVTESAQGYQASHSDVKISVSGGGSYVGISQAMSRSVDIGDSDVIAPGNSGLRDHKVAVVGFGVIVNPAAGVSALSKKQIRDIFSGRVTNWKNVGGKDLAIAVINRPRSSGTRAVFVAKLMGNKEPAEGLTEDSSGTVVTTVAQTPGAVSYVSTSYLKHGTGSTVSVDGVAPADANLTNGKYTVWSYEHMYTNGRPGKAVGGCIAYVSNDAALLKQLGVTPVKALKPK